MRAVASAERAASSVVMATARPEMVGPNVASRNGTWINGKRVSKHVARSGDDDRELAGEEDAEDEENDSAGDHDAGDDVGTISTTTRRVEGEAMRPPE